MYKTKLHISRRKYIDKNMNIFFLSICPYVCAKMHCDSHVIKMILEYAQMLCTAHHVCGNYKNPDLYKIAFKNNPCAVWARTTSGNYSWLYELFIHWKLFNSFFIHVFLSIYWLFSVLIILTAFFCESKKYYTFNQYIEMLLFGVNTVYNRAGCVKC